MGLFVNKFITMPRVDGSHPGSSSSFFVGHTRQLEMKTFGRTNDVEREAAKKRGSGDEEDGRTGRRTRQVDVKKAFRFVRFASKTKTIKWLMPMHIEKGKTWRENN